jgi:hypothetical protein
MLLIGGTGSINISYIVGINCSSGDNWGEWLVQQQRTADWPGQIAADTMAWGFRLSCHLCQNSLQCSISNANNHTCYNELHRCLNHHQRVPQSPGSIWVQMQQRQLRSSRGPHCNASTTTIKHLVPTPAGPPATRNSTGASATTTGSTITKSGERGRKEHDSYLRAHQQRGASVCVSDSVNGGQVLLLLD